MSRPSIFAPVGPGGIPAAAAAGDGSVWVWPTEAPCPRAPEVARGEPVEDIPWDEMMRRHGRRVVVALVSRGVPLERAKELAQDAWMKVIDRHRAGQLPEVTLPGLVITQAGFLARDDLRRQERRARLDEPRQRASHGVALDLEQQLDARQQLRVVRTVLDRASPSAQRVFALLYGANAMTPAEAAAELGLSVQRVRQIVCELRKRIRAELDHPGGNER
ncbi:MAG: sigma-70 family RNA polymerase sigma factor [Myxococcales bacterium]|nr:sigma-70 family RNA polymerase sigma factor [Myxococcales bacterium]